MHLDMRDMTGKNPILINLPPEPDKKPEFVTGRQNGKSTTCINNLIEKMKQERLDNIVKDPSRKWRTEIQECRNCYYSGYWGGQAITTSTCHICGKEMTFPSTAVDQYCIDCAKKYGICKHCGVKID